METGDKQGSPERSLGLQPIEATMPPHPDYAPYESSFIPDMGRYFGKVAGKTPLLQRGMLIRINGQEYRVINTGVANIEYVPKANSNELGRVRYEIWLMARNTCWIIFDFEAVRKLVYQFFPDLRKPDHQIVPALAVENPVTSESFVARYPEDEQAVEVVV